MDVTEPSSAAAATISPAVSPVDGSSDRSSEVSAAATNGAPIKELDFAKQPEPAAEPAAAEGAGAAPAPAATAPATPLRASAPVIPALSFQIGAVVVGNAVTIVWAGCVKASYTPSFATAIAAEEGDNVEIVSATDSDWWTVKNHRSGEQGFMPAAMIDVSSEVEDAMERAGAQVARRSPHASAGEENTKKGFGKLTRLGKAGIGKVAGGTADLAMKGVGSAVSATAACASRCVASIPQQQAPLLAPSLPGDV